VPSAQFGFRGTLACELNRAAVADYDDVTDHVSVEEIHAGIPVRA
jgi:hypothetical protein